MPNTLAHFGVQGVATRLLFRRAAAKWIFLGAVVPDLPWILQRTLATLLPTIDRYDLRLFAIVQSSLAFCLLLCGAVALATATPYRVFGILGLNSFLHLAFDALQTKWANGAHLLAPFSWKLWNSGYFWPESLVNAALTALGVAWLGWEWRRSWREPGRPSSIVSTPSGARRAGAGILLLAYCAAPGAFVNGPYAEDNHSIRILRERDARPGRPVEFDRNLYLAREGGAVLRTFAGEELEVTGELPTRTGIVSVRATFVTPERIEIHEYHRHLAWIRDLASYVGLAVVGGVWVAVWKRHDRRLQGARPTR